MSSINERSRIQFGCGFRTAQAALRAARQSMSADDPGGVKVTGARDTQAKRRS
jgi:hypothetical protein